MNNPKLPPSLLPIEPPKLPMAKGEAAFSLLVRDPRSMSTEFLLITVNPDTTAAAIVADLERLSLEVLHMMPLPALAVPTPKKAGVN